MIEQLRKLIGTNEPEPVQPADAEPVIIELEQDSTIQRQMDAAMIELQKRLNADPVSGLVRGTYKRNVRRGAAGRREANVHT
jgi:hypothetical protein